MRRGGATEEPPQVGSGGATGSGRKEKSAKSDEPAAKTSKPEVTVGIGRIDGSRLRAGGSDSGTLSFLLADYLESSEALNRRYDIEIQFERPLGGSDADVVIDGHISGTIDYEYDDEDDEVTPMMLSTTGGLSMAIGSVGTLLGVVSLTEKPSKDARIMTGLSATAVVAGVAGLVGSGIMLKKQRERPRNRYEWDLDGEFHLDSESGKSHVSAESKNETVEVDPKSDFYRYALRELFGKTATELQTQLRKHVDGSTQN